MPFWNRNILFQFLEKLGFIRFPQKAISISQWPGKKTKRIHKDRPIFNGRTLCFALTFTTFLRSLKVLYLDFGSGSKKSSLRDEEHQVFINSKHAENPPFLAPSKLSLTSAVAPMPVERLVKSPPFHGFVKISSRRLIPFSTASISFLILPGANSLWT